MKTKTGRTLKVAAGVLLAGVLATVGAASAEAASENVSNTQEVSVLIYGDNLRYHPRGSVSFRLDYTEQFDQAGLFLRVDEHEWVKAGVEISDGVAQLGAVVTHRTSDWSVAPVPEWVGRVVTVRASRSGDAVTVRARVDDEPLRLVRLAWLDPAARVSAGLLCAAQIGRAHV